MFVNGGLLCGVRSMAGVFVSVYLRRALFRAPSHLSSCKI